jgi:short-subunit dehydrogenase
MPWAVITGASSGLGAAVAEKFAAKQFDVMLVARSEAPLRAAAEKIAAAHGVRAAVCAADLGSAAGVGVLEAALATLPSLDVLVNNAGFGNYGRAWELDVNAEIDSIRLNVEAVVRLTRFALPRMIAAGTGVIVNIASTAGFQPVPYFATYGATKSFVVNYSESVAAELAGAGQKGVRVVAVCPGPFESGFQARAKAESAAKGGVPVETVESIAEKAVRAAAGSTGSTITGWFGELTVFLNRFTPRKVTMAVSEKMFRPSGATAKSA